MQVVCWFSSFFRCPDCIIWSIQMLMQILVRISQAPTLPQTLVLIKLMWLLSQISEPLSSLQLSDWAPFFGSCRFWGWISDFSFALAYMTELPILKLMWILGRIIVSFHRPACMIIITAKSHLASGMMTELLFFVLPTDPLFFRLVCWQYNNYYAAQPIMTPGLKTHVVGVVSR